MNEFNASDSAIVTHCVQARGGWLWEITERFDGSKVEKRLERTDKEDGWCQHGWYMDSARQPSSAPEIGAANSGHERRRAA